MWKRLTSLIRKEFIQIIRDPRTLAMTFVMPVVMMFLLGYAATTMYEHRAGGVGPGSHARVAPVDRCVPRR